MIQVTTDASAGPSRFEALDAWRGICALLVAFLHAPFDHAFAGAPALDNFQFCVDMFFVLSGFVLMHGFGPRLSGAAEVRRFAIVRVGRLWPLHVVVLALFVLIELARLTAARHGGGVGLATAPFGPGRSPGEIVDNLLMLQTIGPTGTFSWNFPAWSVAVEFWTSLVFAALVWRFGPRRPLPFLVLALGSGLALHGLSPDTPLVIERWGLVRCLCDFSVGCVAYQLRGRIHAAIGRLPPLPASALELGLVAIATGFIATVRPGPAGFLAPLLWAAFVLVFSAERGAVSRLLRARVPQAIGRWSFSIYMLHVLVFEVAHAVAHALEAHVGQTLIVPSGDGELITTGSPVADLALALAVLALAVVPLAALSHRVVERPALAAFKAWAAPRRRRSDAAAVDATSECPAVWSGPLAPDRIAPLI